MCTLEKLKGQVEKCTTRQQMCDQAKRRVGRKQQCGKRWPLFVRPPPLVPCRFPGNMSSLSSRLDGLPLDSSSSSWSFSAQVGSNDCFSSPGQSVTLGLLLE